MPQMHCNFFSYSLGHGVDLTITLPGVSPTSDAGKIPGVIPLTRPWK